MSKIPGIKDLLKIVHELHQLHDHSVLLERILHEARIFVRADAGTLYLRLNNKLYFNYIENDTLFPDGTSENKFAYTDKSIPIDTASLAGFVAVTGEPLLIDDSYNLEGDLAQSFNPNFDKETDYRTESQMIIPLIGKKKEVRGVIQLINAKKDGKVVPFSELDKVYITYLADHAVVALEKADMAREMVMRLVRVLEMRDPYESRNHARRIGEYSVTLYDRYTASRGISLAERNLKKEAFKAAAVLHDLGKAGVPSELLAHDGQYTQNEKIKMYCHTIYGARLFPDVGSMWDRIAREVTLNHHERWDGSGYPGRITDLQAEPTTFGSGKKEREIPLSARIVAIADVYDALTTPRSYKDLWTPKAALHYIKNKSGKLFDPELVEVFVTMTDMLEDIRRNLP